MHLCMRWPLLAYYRGHVIVLLKDKLFTAEITERGTAAPFPTKVSATEEEGEQVCLERAKALVDLYLDLPT